MYAGYRKGMALGHLHEGERLQKDSPETCDPTAPDAREQWQCPASEMVQQCHLVDTAWPAQGNPLLVWGLSRPHPHPCTEGWVWWPYRLHGAPSNDHCPAFLHHLGKRHSWIQEQEFQAALTEAA